MGLGRPLIRNLRAGSLLQSFLVAAVSSVLAIRLYLQLTGYPQLGGGRYHVAHMLWGGLLMLTAIVMLLSFFGKATARFAAVIGGVGFGAFIDEVGKFVTRDNDYFFRPAVAMIYIVFVALFLAARALHAGRARSDREYLVNALAEMEEVALHDLDEAEKHLALGYLARSDPSNPLVTALTGALAAVPVVPRSRPPLIERVVRGLRDRYEAMAASHAFAPAVAIVFVAELAGRLVSVGRTLFRPDTSQVLDAEGLARAATGNDTPAFVAWAVFVSLLFSASFVTRGLWWLRRSRLEGYRMLERSVLVSVLLTHVFHFYEEQLGALVGLALSLALLIALRFAIDEERRRIARRVADRELGTDATAARPVAPVATRR